MLLKFWERNQVEIKTNNKNICSVPERGSWRSKWRQSSFRHLNRDSQAAFESDGEI